MTTITANAFAGTSSLSQASLSAEFVLAAGIIGRAMNPLNAGPRASAQLPSLWSVALQSEAAPEPAAQWTATTGADGKASVDLGDGYTLQLNENSSEMTIHNAATNETTQIWGDPHVNVDGKHAFDFAGTTTFELANGTKITVGTEQGKGNPDVYYANNVTITKGDQAIVVNGLSEQTKGDLSVSMSNNGRQIDAQTRDGYVLEENTQGSGWLSSYTGKVATQDDMNATFKGGAFAPGSEMPSLQELGSVLSGFLLFGLSAGLGMAVASAMSGEGDSFKPAPSHHDAGSAILTASLTVGLSLAI